MSPYEVQLLACPKRLEEHCAAIQQRIEHYQDAEMFFKWMGSVIHTDMAEAKGKGGKSRTDEMEESEDDDALPVDFQLRQVAEQLEAMRAVISTEWKDAKAAVKDAEYRRNKHKLTKLAAKLDTTFPSIQDTLKRQATRRENERRQAHREITDNGLKTEPKRPEQPSLPSSSSSSPRESHLLVQKEIAQRFQELGIEFV